ncbi:DUF2235 domain-containing protein [Marinomonas foliarum]|uniref:Putative alpha/beta hydrolase family protein DUF2235 n=1 Tax=Marinomonas foliarum TaxID=491950 RepID=A0A368ZTN9_9GAMM|nr:DUF2235 domain-containing protein [Marinomonas foliarum]RCX00353.1 putative alpha/beta hydrolase family protein DUF2235 [Marinomonas foliarum]
MSTLFFHFDGTDNSPNDACAPEHNISSITNVLKSHLLLGGRLQSHTNTTSNHLPYRSFYYAAFAIESGHVANILNRALNDFKNHYNQSIRHIVLIGFSRGAALARRFAALITPLIDRPIIIEAVIDTVASIGWPNLDIAKRLAKTKQPHWQPLLTIEPKHLVKIHYQQRHWQPLLTIEPKHLVKIHYQQRRLRPWRELTLAPRHCCVLENDQPNHTLSPHWHHSVTQRIRSDIGYFPIAYCPTPAILWRSTTKT